MVAHSAHPITGFLDDTALTTVTTPTPTTTVQGHWRWQGFDREGKRRSLRGREWRDIGTSTQHLTPAAVSICLQGGSDANCHVMSPPPISNEHAQWVKLV